MKAIVYLFAMLFSTGAFAQSNFYTTVMDNSYGEYLSLYELPWDQSQLVQVKSEYVPLPQAHSVYSFETISNGLTTPFYIPFCADISSPPLFLNNGILATGTTPLNGVECVFFDGTNVLEFDLNQGAGDSDPLISQLGERAFVLANDGNVKQLYEFDKINHTMTKITNSPIDVNAVCAIWGDDVYYSTVFVNTTLNQTEYALSKASFQNGSFTYSEVQSVAIPIIVDRFVHWGSPVVKWDKLFITQSNQSSVSGVLSDIEVLSIDENEQVELVHQMAQTEFDYVKLFEWDDALWTYVQGLNQLFVCRDGASFGLDTDTGLKTLSNHYVTDNYKLYLDLSIPQSENHEIVALNGMLQTIYTGVHMHILMEDNDIVYLSDWKWYDSSSIVLIHTAFDGFEKIYIDQAAHSPVANASLIHNGEFTFLFAHDFADIDVLKLTGSPSANIEEQEVSIGVFPNPISQGHAIFVESENGGVAQILSSDGKLVKSFEIVPGVNEIETSSINSGVYILLFENRAHRVVVN